MSERAQSTEEALELFLAERRRGERIEAAQFAAEYPELAPELGSALESLLALERANRSAPDEALPARIGAFRIVREVGRGGMGVVLEALEQPLGRRVALKVIPAGMLASPSARERFRREAALAARLDHPGIATIYGAGVDDERPWIAMRFVEGRTLAQAIAEARESGSACAQIPGPAGNARAQVLALAACIARVARALHAAHEQGVVHRDLKPSNIIVAPDGSPVLLDFGLAITEEHEGQSLTRTGETAGTPAYLAPELLGGERTRPDAQCDVYSLGLTLYECLALQRAYDAATPAALYRAILSGPAPDLRARRAVPRELSVIVATAMERDRARRYRSAAALADDLEACVAGRPIVAHPLPLHGRLLRWARREPRQAVLAGLLALATLAVATLGGNWWASRDEVHAAEENARRNALEDAIGDGFYKLGLQRQIDAEADFARAAALEPSAVEPLVGRVLAGLGRRPAPELHALLGRLPPGTAGSELLSAMIDGQGLPDSAASADLQGLSAVDLGIRGLCLLRDSVRQPFTQRGARNAQALRCFTEAILRAPLARPLYYEQRAFTAQLASDAAAARSAAAALQLLWPNSPRALYAAGRALQAFDNPAARRLLERSIALDPHMIDAYNLLALTCCNSGDPEAAESCCWRALALDPDSANMLYWLGESLARRNCADEASVALRAALARQPMAAGWAELGLLVLLSGDPASATCMYARSLELDPGQGRVRVFYGAALELAGDPASGRAELQQGLAGIFPQDAAFWRTTSAVFSYVHAPQSSLLAAEAGLALAPGDAELESLRAGAAQELAR